MRDFLHNLFKKHKSLKLEFCHNNLDRFLDDESLFLFNQFFSESSVMVKEFDCLSHCELCREKPYVMANGEMICADGGLQLLEKLKGLKQIG